MGTEVVISGGGPNGLMLACELCLAGVRPIVLEQLVEPGEEPKANGLLGEVVRLVDQRGLYERLAGDAGPPVPNQAYVMFAAMPLDLSVLDASPVYTLAVPQREIVAALIERAVALGAEIRRGHELVGFAQDDEGVEVEVVGPDGRYRLSSDYLVGADGAHSATRKLAGIDFPGITYDRTTARSAHATVPIDWVDARTGGLEIPGYGSVLPFLAHRTEQGGFSYAPFPGRPPLISTTEWDEAKSSEAMSLVELEASIWRVLGAELPLGEPDGSEGNVLRRRYGGNTRIAGRFRQGRVFLVGGAAHVYGAAGGGPGLNLGFFDAVNLGWKLAAVLRREAGQEFLDSYERERRPAAERMSMSTQAQAALIAPGADVTALRGLFAELLGDVVTTQRIADLVAGVGLPYEMGAEKPHPSVGLLAPELSLRGEQGAVRLAELTRAARPLLIDMTERGTLAEEVREWGDTIEVVAARPDGDPAVTALLLRPDCHVAWASASSDPGPAEREALRSSAGRWFGRSDRRGTANL